MTTLKILAAAALVAFSAPAFAGDNNGGSVDQKAVEFVAQGNSQRLIEGRNSDRAPVQHQVEMKTAVAGN